MSGRHGVQYVAQCVACAALTLVVRQSITNLCAGGSVGHDLSMGDTEDLRYPFFFFSFTPVTDPRRSLSLNLSKTRVYEP